MKCKLLFILIFTSNIILGQGTVEAEFDTIYKYKFKSLKRLHQKNILIDASHNTIYSMSYGKDSAREMLRIMEADGFKLDFTNKKLNEKTLNNEKVDLLIIHGMPNDKIVLETGNRKEIFYTSPLSNKEVADIGGYVYNGGSLLLFLSHFPGGSGALPLLEGFSVKFRDGYAYQKQYHITEDKGKCGHFLMNKNNSMLNLKHPVFANRLDKNILPKNIKYYCGAAIFRNPEDAILSFPNNTINYTPSKTNENDMEEISNNYAAMIGFQYGAGRVIICTDQGIFRSLDLLIDNKKIAVTIHDSESENAALLINSIRWLTKLEDVKK